MSDTRQEKRVKERIAKDLAEHVITVRHEQGMYRHYRCQKPGTWNMGFDIVTWPGSLCYTGDMGDYLFQRTEDMIAFMRGSCMSYGYAAEKCVAHDGRVTEFSEERFREILHDRIAEAEHGDRRKEVREKVDVILREFSNYSAPADAEKAMYESGLWDDMPSCKEYTFHFLWCLHALEWFCDHVAAGSRVVRDKVQS